MRRRLPWSCDDLDPAERVRPWWPAWARWRAAARSALGVSESAVSQAITALRQDLGDQLITRRPGRHDADAWRARGCLAPRPRSSCSVPRRMAAVAAPRRGAPEQLRVVATSTLRRIRGGAGLLEAFRRRFAGAVEITTGGGGPRASSAWLIANRLAGRGVRAGGDRRARAAGGQRAQSSSTGSSWSARGKIPGHGGKHRAGPGPRGPRQAVALGWWTRRGTDPGSETARLLRRLGVADGDHRCLPEPDRRPWAARRRRRGGSRLAIEHLGVAPVCGRGGLSLIDLPGFPVEECWYATLLEAGSGAAPPASRACAGSSAPRRRCR